MNLTFTKATAMFRTPAKTGESSPGSRVSQRSTEKAGPTLSSVRRSIGEWEAGKAEPQSKSPAKQTNNATRTPPAPNTQETRREPEDAARASKRPESGYPNVVAEARACLNKAKLHLGNSRNLKTDIKTGVLNAINRLYELVKEAARDKAAVAPAPVDIPAAPQTAALLAPPTDEQAELMRTLVAGLKEHKQALQENQNHTQALSEHLQRAPRFAAGQGPTFAEIAAIPKQNVQEPLHSVIVSSVDNQDTGEEVIAKLRTAVDARNEGTRVERLRKARDQKVVVGFKTREELSRVTERIRKAGNLVVEEVKNKDPLIIVMDVLSCHSDAEITLALQRQNSHLVGDLPAEDLRLGVKYRRRTRNPHTCHVVLQVSPAVWQRLTTAGRVHIDLQRVRVQDQSPLVQCTRCLRFGHSRKLCTQPADLCIHCGEPHLRADCPSRLAAEAPKCHNCLMAKLDNTDHNAFDHKCPLRQKWDALARLSVAYC